MREAAEGAAVALAELDVAGAVDGSLEEVGGILVPEKFLLCQNLAQK